MGYDGLVRRWKNENEVTTVKGYVLFNSVSILAVHTDLTVRDLARYGILEDVEISPNAENSMSINVMGISAPIILAFRSHDERSLFLSAVGKKL